MHISMMRRGAMRRATTLTFIAASSASVKPAHGEGERNTQSARSSAGGEYQGGGAARACEPAPGARVNACEMGVRAAGARRSRGEVANATLDSSGTRFSNCTRLEAHTAKLLIENLFRVLHEEVVIIERRAPRHQCPGGGVIAPHRPRAPARSHRPAVRAPTGGTKEMM